MSYILICVQSRSSGGPPAHPCVYNGSHARNETLAK
jgi:hypothetical protein